MDKIAVLLENNESLRKIFMRIYVEAGIENVTKGIGIEKYLRLINPVPLSKLLEEARAVLKENGEDITLDEIKKFIVTWAEKKLETAFANPPK